MSRKGRGKRFLFVCVHNSGRSQMAEAFTRHLSNGAVEAESAGTQPSTGVNPIVVEAMAEVGIDLAGHYPKVISQEMVNRADSVFTMGCSIDESCPATFVPSEDWGLEDPAGNDIEHVRRIRDQIKAKVRELLRDCGNGDP
ncbi:MAG: arsenate reductase ArsC [Chloroflexi bacterium]|nr:arsenate reductase ArsC [Chloroflexota bacterium]